MPHPQTANPWTLYMPELVKKLETQDKIENDNCKQEAVGKKIEASLVEPEDEISLEPIDEVCEKVFVIPRYKVDNHNIGIEYDVKDKLKAKVLKVKSVRVERLDGNIRGDFTRCEVTIEPTSVKILTLELLIAWFFHLHSQDFILSFSVGGNAPPPIECWRGGMMHDVSVTSYSLSVYDKHKFVD